MEISSECKGRREENRSKAADNSGSSNPSGFAYSCSRLSLFMLTAFDVTVSLLHIEPQLS